RAQPYRPELAAMLAEAWLRTREADKLTTLTLDQRGDWQRWKWVVSALDGVKPRAFRLTNGTWLFAAQTLGVRESSREPDNRWLTTLKYTYQWQANEDNRSWMVRWCYSRERDG